MRLIPLLLILLFSSKIVVSKENEEPKSNKGKIYAFWGWNKGWYSNSDIRFTGNNYDFTLNDVKATDKQTPFDFNTYFNPSTITIPQTNFRIGYFINDKIDISFGVDHMKYVMNRVQDVEITGRIDDNTEFDGIYSNNDFEVNKDFLEFEHTDGLNYLNFEITRNDDLLKILKVTNNTNRIQIHTLIGFGIGVMMPKSNVTLWNNERYDDFNIAGYGFAGKVGLNITFFKYLFFRGELKEGFIDMPNIRTSLDPSDRAKQHFFFTQLNFVFGFSFSPFN